VSERKRVLRTRHIELLSLNSLTRSRPGSTALGGCSSIVRLALGRCEEVCCPCRTVVKARGSMARDDTSRHVFLILSCERVRPRTTNATAALKREHDATNRGHISTRGEGQGTRPINGAGGRELRSTTMRRRTRIAAAVVPYLIPHDTQAGERADPRAFGCLRSGTLKRYMQCKEMKEAEREGAVSGRYVSLSAMSRVTVEIPRRQSQGR